QRSGQPAALFVPVTMLITAGFFAVAATPTFLFLRERAVPQPATENAWKRVRDTLQHAREYRDLRRFLLCMLFYQAGVTAVVALAAIYAEQVMKFTTERTIMLILVVNVTAALGAFAFGYLQDAIGHVRAIALTLVGWIAMVVIAASSHSVFSFWVAANLAGLCMGSSQAAGRALVGYLAPQSRVAEFFGLWGLSVKAASIFGPLTYGAVTWSFGGNHRLAILATGAYFVIGLALLAGIDVRRGRQAAIDTLQRTG
ncbi:MAG: MFS transporter, partial [Betaproteobacteria bacterium]